MRFVNIVLTLLLSMGCLYGETTQATPTDRYRIMPGDVVEILFGLNRLDRETYRLSPGDRVEVKFIAFPELDIQQRVRPDGKIALPYLGDYSVADSTPNGLRLALQESYREQLSTPEIIVVLKEIGGMRSELLAVSDNESGQRGKSVKIRSDGVMPLPFAGEIQAAGKTVDQIKTTVAQRYREIGFTGLVDISIERAEGARISVLGAVQRPGTFTVDQPMRVFEAVAMAGGMRTDAKSKRVFVLRADEKGFKCHRINVHKALRGKSKDTPFALASHDIVFVPRRGIVKASEMVQHLGQMILFRGWSVDAGRFVYPSGIAYISISGSETENMKSENHLRFFAVVFFSHRKLIVRTTVAFVAAAFVLSLTYPPVYVLEGALVVKSKELPDQPETAQLYSAARGTLPPSAEDVLLETRVVTDLKLVTETVEELMNEGVVFPQHPFTTLTKPIVNLFSNIAFLSKEQKVEKEPKRGKEEFLAASLRQKITASVFPGSNVIDVRLNYHDPVVGQKLLDRLLQKYSSFRLRLFADQTARNFYAMQVAEYRNEIQKHNQNALTIMKKNGVSNPERELNALIELINKYSQESEQMRDDIREGEYSLAYLENVRGQYARAAAGERISLPPPIDLGNSSRQRTAMLEHLIGQYKEMKRFSEISAQGKDIAAKIHEELGNVISWEKERLGSLAQQLSDKEERLKNFQNKAIQLRALESKMDRVNTDAELSKQNYQVFFTKLEESKLKLGSEISQWASVQILTRPLVPVHPAFPRPVVVIPLGIVAGFLLAVALAWMQEFFDHTFKHPSHVEEILDLPVIGYLPARQDAA